MDTYLLDDQGHRCESSRRTAVMLEDCVAGPREMGNGMEQGRTGVDKDREKIEEGITTYGLDKFDDENAIGSEPVPEEPKTPNHLHTETRSSPQPSTKTSLIPTVNIETLSQQTDTLVSWLGSGKQTLDAVRALGVSLVHDMNAYADGAVEHSESDNERDSLANMGKNMVRVTGLLDLWHDTPDELRELLGPYLDQAFLRLCLAHESHDENGSAPCNKHCNLLHEESLLSKANVAATAPVTRDLAPRAPPPLAALEILAHQILFLLSALTHSPGSIEANYAVLCTTVCMLEAYKRPVLSITDYEHRLVLGISENIEGALAVYGKLGLPETYAFSVGMSRLAEAFGGLLDGMFEGARRERSCSGVDEMGCGEKNSATEMTLATDQSVPKPHEYLDDTADVRTEARGGAQRPPKCTASCDNCMLKDDILEPTVTECGVPFKSIGETISPQVQLSTIPVLRGGGCDTSSDYEHRRSSFAENFERLYDDLLRQSVETGGDTAPPPCTEAWMQLAGLLQMRNSYLEHQVREVRDTNDSLAEDVAWLVDVQARLEEELREVQSDRIAAWTEARNLQAQLPSSQKHDAAMESGASDGESTYTDMTMSGSSELSACCNIDAGTKISHSSHQRSSPTHRTPAQDNFDSPQAPRTSLPPPTIQAHAFYFFPRTSLILLTTPQSTTTYHFPPGTMLPQIHQSLISQFHDAVKHDPVFQIMHILDVREYLGIQTPDPVNDELIRIDLPDLACPDNGGGAPMAAWEVPDFEVPEHPDGCWQAWNDVQPRCRARLNADSGQTSCVDADELFRGWSWSGAGSAACSSGDQSPCTRRVCRVECGGACARESRCGHVQYPGLCSPLCTE
ncbi:hypothetical protein C7974DRAFT_446357 [Boeremia exigua]|uniref:uncharacterized protein n=1 Tax=Boeremia exigua TaxID=749465 RepID=UPI001E8EAF57|nr:uncharacterized protein C7974DRAFT_446357 [Boeremia exigua]KAH6642028.1 hypothetical protein C7974DRAFT_446357 [Boeremia exigua]